MSRQATLLPVSGLSSADAPLADHPGQDREPVASTPKIIWTLWWQGYDQAPPLVRLCLESWRLRNPGWTIRALDRTTFRDFVDIPPDLDLEDPDLPIEKVSNLIRMMLLRQKGGVWVDATVFCCRPLDSWLPAEAGFAAFRNPGRDRLSSNWFIAARRDDPLLAALHDQYLRVWSDKRFRRPASRPAQMLMKWTRPYWTTDPRRTLLISSPLALRLLRLKPYHLFHYIFNRVVLTDARLAEAWRAAPRLPAKPCHKLRHLGKEQHGLDRALAFIADGRAPVQKLDWRQTDGPYWGPVIDALGKTLSTG